MEITDTPAIIDPATEKVIAEARRRPATFGDLVKKKRRESDVVIASVDDAGNDLELVLRFRALSPKEFDDLVAQYPPNTKQKAEGMAYNPDTFGPALVAAVSLEPKLTVGEVTELIDSGVWSPGEVNTLTGSAMQVCQTGAGVPFTARG
jgi:hypothetical protein